MAGWFTEQMADQGTAFSLRLGKGRHLHGEKTPYQTIDIYDTETFGILMVIDGCTMVSTRENFLYHEMMTHPALNSHAAPRDVAIIGGGDCGTLTQVLKHPEVRHATQIDIDERVTRLAEQYFPELTEVERDPRATLLFDDGIKWVKDAAQESLDLIIIDSTDPVGPAEGLFGRKFYKDCIRALRPGGLLVQQSESPLLHLDLIAEMAGYMHEAGFAATRLLHFPQPIYPSGWWSSLHARKGGTQWVERLDAAAVKALGTRYYSAEMHRAAFVMPPFVAARLGTR
ncbi:MAG: polyamine aminopropyltransferase [Nevskiaceae bacterium]|nr:MAG: polyamine aminopropyltransferase [Nevskiaceae bacterium]TBR74333.1 MAG: polyamine aminopropyltransferase [Nevskiaceae bacterium]